MQLLELLRGLDLQTIALIAMGFAIYFTKGDLTKLKPLLDKLLEGLKPKPQLDTKETVDLVLDRAVEKLLPAVLKVLDAQKDRLTINVKNDEPKL